MKWQLSHRCDPEARELADRHYSRHTPGAKNFVPPGRCIVLKVPKKAYWVTAYPFAEYVRHAWGGAWICSAFRNEGAGLSSDLIREAIAATRYMAGVLDNWDVSKMGMITFVDLKHVKPKTNPGYCYLKAGFVTLEEKTKGGLIVLHMPLENMPEPRRPKRTKTPDEPPGIFGKTKQEYAKKKQRPQIIKAKKDPEDVPPSMF